jgi:hypothetical protein
MLGELGEIEFAQICRFRSNLANFPIWPLFCQNMTLLNGCEFPPFCFSVHENNMKRKLVYNCENCDDFRAKIAPLKEDNAKLVVYMEKTKNKIVSLSNTVDFWKKRAQKAEADLGRCRVDPLIILEATNDVCAPHDLSFEKFGNYCEELLEKQPDLGGIIQPMFSTQFKQSYNSAEKDSQWFAGASFYKAFLLDVIIRTKNPKAVMRTNLALGIALYRSKVPEYAWRLLQKLKILPCIQYVEKYLELLPQAAFSDDKFLFFHYDNFSMYDHVRKKLSTHKSEFRHFVSRLVFGIPREIDIPLTQVFKRYNAEDVVKFA